MPLFGPPDGGQLKARRDINGLIKAWETLLIPVQVGREESLMSSHVSATGAPQDRSFGF
jgi:hypothetical protein